MNTTAGIENASQVTSFHQYFNTYDWRNGNIEKMKSILEENPSLINKVRPNGKILLIEALESRNCSDEAVKLLLHYGADVNYRNNSSALITALWCSQNDKVIKILLDNGARLYVQSPISEGYWVGLSPLCIAFCTFSSKKVVKLLLDSGSSIHTCMQHVSTIQCFFSVSTLNLHLYRRMRDEVFQLLIESGTELSKLDAQGRSSLCYALHSDARGCHIELMMEMGCSLNACREHPSPFFCIVGAQLRTLRADVVQTLLKAGVSVQTRDKEGLTILQHVLYWGRYKEEAIVSMLNAPGVDVNMYQSGNSLLHCAMRRCLCDLAIYKLLLDKGADVNALNENGDSVLDVAARQGKGLDVINLLLKNQCIINAPNNTTSKPLSLAVEWFRYPRLVETLLIAGARIGMAQNRHRHPLLCHALNSSGYMENFKILVKFYFLEYSEFEDMIQGHRFYQALRGFADECMSELREMETKSIGFGRSLRQLIGIESPPQMTMADCKVEGKDFDINPLLRAISVNAFPLYFNVILAKVGRETLEKKLPEFPMYTIKHSANLPHSEERVTLNHHVMCIIVSHLSDADLMTLMLSFYKPDEHAASKRASEEQNNGGPEQSNSQKHPKFV